MELTLEMTLSWNNGLTLPKWYPIIISCERDGIPRRIMSCPNKIRTLTLALCQWPQCMLLSATVMSEQPGSILFGVKSRQAIHWTWNVRIYCCCTFPGDDYAARFLIENGADVNIALPKSRLTPLHLCLMHPHDEWLPNPMAGIVELLLQKSADPNARSSDSRSVYKKLCYHWQTAQCFCRSVKVTKHGAIQYVSYGFLLVCYSNFVDLYTNNDLETLVRDHSKSLQMIPFNRRPMTSYWRSINSEP